MEEVFINPVTGAQFEGFSLRRGAKNLIGAGRRLAGKTKLSRWAMDRTDNVLDHGNRYVPGRFRFEGEDFDGFSLKKAFKRKEGGTFMGNMLRGVAQNAKGMIPGGNLLPIGDGLMMKKPDIQAAPAPAVEVAQTPQQAQAVVQALAPTLTGQAAQTAVGAVMQANDPESATRVAASLAALNDKKQKEQKTAYLIGGGIASALLIGLIIWLIVRK